MNYDKSILNFQDVILTTMDKIDKKIHKDNPLNTLWQEVLLKITNYGEQFYEHSRLVNVKNNIATVEVDHTGWLQLLKMHNTFILKGLNLKDKKIKVTSIVYKLKNS